MPSVKIIDREGEGHAVEAKAGLDLIELVRDHDFGEKRGRCESCCA